MTCEWCQSKPATITKADKLHVCKECESLVAEYYECSICHTILNPELAKFYRNNFYSGFSIVCGSRECQFKADVKHGYYCCEKAMVIPCVCARSYKCPDHYPHGVHIGTHD